MHNTDSRNELFLEGLVILDALGREDQLFLFLFFLRLLAGLLLSGSGLFGNLFLDRLLRSFLLFGLCRRLFFGLVHDFDDGLRLLLDQFDTLVLGEGIGRDHGEAHRENKHERENLFQIHPKILLLILWDLSYACRAPPAWGLRWGSCVGWYVRCALLLPITSVILRAGVSTADLQQLRVGCRTDVGSAGLPAMCPRSVYFNRGSEPRLKAWGWWVVRSVRRGAVPFPPPTETRASGSTRGACFRGSAAPPAPCRQVRECHAHATTSKRPRGSPPQCRLSAPKLRGATPYPAHDYSFRI